MASHPANTVADAHVLYAALAKTERAFSDQLRSISFPPQMAADVSELLRDESDLEIVYLSLASADETGDRAGSPLHQSEDEAILALGQAGNLVREDLGLPSSVLWTPGPRPSGPAPGSIVFGKAYNLKTLLIDKPVSQFTVSVGSICWSASLTQPAGSTSLELVLGRVVGGGENRVSSTQLDLSDPLADLDAGCLTLSGAQVGHYVLRFVRAGTILAEGRFTIVK